MEARARAERRCILRAVAALRVQGWGWTGWARGERNKERRHRLETTVTALEENDAAAAMASGLQRASC